MAEQEFTHLDSDGRARMVDVSGKEATRRTAEASCVVRSRLDLLAIVPPAGGLDPGLAARLAGVQAAKRTSRLIPLCHPVDLDDVHVEIERRDDGVVVRASVVTVHRTGVEMEALTACCVAALSLLGAVVDRDPRARVEDLALLRKTGGTSADWGRLIAETRA